MSNSQTEENEARVQEDSPGRENSTAVIIEVQPSLGVGIPLEADDGIPLANISETTWINAHQEGHGCAGLRLTRIVEPTSTTRTSKNRQSNVE